MLFLKLKNSLYTGVGMIIYNHWEFSPILSVAGHPRHVPIASTVISRCNWNPTPDLTSITRLRDCTLTVPYLLFLHLRRCPATILNTVFLHTFIEEKSSFSRYIFLLFYSNFYYILRGSIKVYLWHIICFNFATILIMRGNF